MIVDSKRPNIPKYKNEINYIESLISKYYTEIFIKLEKEFNKEQINQQRVRSIVQEELKNMSNVVESDIKKIMTKVFNDGQAQSLIGAYQTMDDEEQEQENLPLQEETAKEELSNLKKKGVTALSLYKARKIIKNTEKNNSQVNAVVNSIMEDLKKMDSSIEKSSVLMARKISQERSMMNLYKSTGNNDEFEKIKKMNTKEKVRERLLKEGMVGIVDSKGRKWKPGTYSKTVVKTKINDTYLDGVRDESEKIGIDLGVISTHGAKDACSKWEGVVISVNGKTPGYPTLAEAKATNEVFHPNCQHSVHMIRNESYLSKRDQRINEIKRKKL